MVKLLLCPKNLEKDRVEMSSVKVANCKFCGLFLTLLNFLVGL